ncbi:MAG: hypothetical protein ABI183_20115 [Polyangiaceae bacterium]
MKRTWISAILFALACAPMLGCGHEVSAQHFDVTLDDDGARYQGSIDFPEYFSGGGCTDDSSTSRDPDNHSCTPSALSAGTIDGISQIISAKIDLDKTTEEPEYVIQIVNDETKISDKFTCWMHSRDVGHAFECTNESERQGALASITLTPV